MEILVKGKILVTNTEAKELLNEVKSESSTKETRRPLIAQEMTKQVLAYLEGTSVCNVTGQEVAATLKRLAAFPPLAGQEGLRQTEMFNIVNVRPSTLVEMFAIIDHAEVRFGDDKLEELLDLIQAELSPPPESEEAPEGDAEAAGEQQDEDVES
mmetsp:Transcript_25163/g.51183  ORF Transcript_25163/g.51183 Transcript_25163/m.51183 type:complete len:155 (+) Transcript_25163:164-628(+)|eukprot:CAMPEP_0181299144 /NCGR_PEP_ID=MMETSP1101-20121128/6177_1 /TAXON_ID=46948 /ORGANISM="Rhodomonas abbreviata, Strain Caron Lab Isolate" /LENGTH=154 /DNA_ID=CAMNT_0023404249 /DNA_START=161 /DNA_END=625 /DNA_ORIENTATION=+